MQKLSDMLDDTEARYFEHVTEARRLYEMLDWRMSADDRRLVESEYLREQQQAVRLGRALALAGR